MKKICLASFLLILFCSSFGGYHTQSDKYYRLPVHKGKCIHVIRLLIEKEKGDTLRASQLFKKNYLLIHDNAYRKCEVKTKEVYKFFSQEKNKYCISKRMLYDERGRYK
jgi:hypothetical protein